MRAEPIHDNCSYITYSPEEMQEHKRTCKARMMANPANMQDPTYQMGRAFMTVTADDADYIPKVAKSRGDFS